MAFGRSKIPLALVFICSLAAVGLIVAAAATTHWVNAVALRENLTDSQPPEVPDKDGLIPAYTGYIQFGLFNGQKIFNFGFQQRDPVYFSIFTEHADVYSIGYPIAVFVLMIIAGIFALVSTIFGMVNTMAVPIETIHGPMGLYLWNAIGAVASLLAWVLYLVLFLTQLTSNVLIQEDIDSPNNFQTSTASLGYSFWLIVASFVLFHLNLLFVLLARLLRDPDFLRRRKREMNIARGANNVGLDDIMY